MAVEYRLMLKYELEGLLDVWTEVYPETERERWRQEFLSIPGSSSQTYVAVEDGRILSTALVWFREMNDAAGSARRIGNVSHVATRPEARRHGHATRLLDMAVEAMQQEGCEFSTLFTSEEARPLYEKLSWRTCPFSCWQGRLAKIDLPVSGEYTVRVADSEAEPDLWGTLAAIYAEFNEDRPLAIRRDVSTWNQLTRYKIRDWVQAGASMWLASSVNAPQAICGYLLAHRGDEGFLVAEAGLREEHKAALADLLSPVFQSYQVGQAVGGRLYLPNEPHILALLESCFDPLMQVESEEMMVRAISREENADDLIVRPSGGREMFWLLDQI